MSLNTTPSSERVHIGIFGKRNAGKSSLINAITGQDIAVVSDTLGTTTDPVIKAMEILPLGPVVIIDTPGLDDAGELGEKRVQKAYDVLRKCDIGILVIDANDELGAIEKALIETFEKEGKQYVICVNKIDEIVGDTKIPEGEKIIKVSAKTKEGIHELKETLANLLPDKNERHLISDLLTVGDVCVLVVPIDESAPKGRLILPQQQTIRDILEAGAIPVVTKETELEITLSKLSEKPKIVITDSQAFSMVAKIVPEDVYLTSFSILMARYKGDLEWQKNGVKTLDEIKDKDKILISEGCTHHRQCKDIGTVKLPTWIRKHCSSEPEFEFTSGGEFPKDLSSYKLIIHCGGCTINENEMRYRIDLANKFNIPITNYGMAISYMNGILDRSLKFLDM